MDFIDWIKNNHFTTIIRDHFLYNKHKDTAYNNFNEKEGCSELSKVRIK